MSALLNVKQFVRFDEHSNLHVPNKLFVACQAYVQTPFLNDTSSRVATTEWVRAQISSLTGVSVSETDPIWVFEKALYYTKLQADARYLQSFTETDPTVSAWAKTSVKPTYTFAELLSKPTTIAGYGITDIPTTLPASDVYAWAKAATKPSYAYSEITGLPALFSGAYADLTGKPTLFSGSYIDLTNKPIIPTYTLSGLGGQPLDADLTAIAALAGTAGFLKKTAADTWALDNNTYLTSYTEIDPIWTAEKTNYATKTYVDTSVSNLVASAPAALNTLNELAVALGNDANFSTTISTLIGTKEPSITAGTTLQYWRGDKSWQTLPIYFLPTASTTVLGGVKVDGVTITINANGVISGANTYVLPTATSTILGGVKIGAGVTITSGVISVSTNYEAPITAGTTAQYWRGDKSWQTLPIYTLAGLGGLPLAGGVMTGAITLKEGAANGIKFPNDAYGGSGDTAGMRLIARSGEDISLEVYVTNDTADWFNIVVPNDSAAKVNGNTIWHVGNLTNLNQLTNGPGYITSYTDTNTVTQIRRENADGTTLATAYRTGDIRLRQGANVTITEVSAGIFQIASSYVDTDTNTTYTAGAGLTLTGTVFSVTDTITTAATANTIAKRDGSAVISAGGFYQTSSKTLKTSITDYNESALDVINKINVVSFYYKADVKNKRIGFIAEDSPEEVATIDHNVMDTNSTVGLLLKAIQQLEARIKVLENV